MWLNLFFYLSVVIPICLLASIDSHSQSDLWLKSEPHIELAVDRQNPLLGHQSNPNLGANGWLIQRFCRRPGSDSPHFVATPSLSILFSFYISLCTSFWHLEYNSTEVSTTWSLLWSSLAPLSPSNPSRKTHLLQYLERELQSNGNWSHGSS